MELRRWPLVAALTRFWADDRGLSIFSLLLLVVVFVLPPLVPPGIGRSLAGDLLHALLLLSGVLALADRRQVRFLLVPTPVHPAARSLAMLEAVTGSLYLALLIARLVSLSVSPRGEDES